MKNLLGIAIQLTHPTVPCWNFSPANLQKLAHSFPSASIVVCADTDALLEALPQAEVVLIWTFRQEWFRRAPRLRLLATPAAGRDYFTVTPPPGIEILYGSFHGEIMAETVVGMMLAHCRGILLADRLRRESILWPREELGKVMKPLRGSHVAILGFGHIGEWIARLSKPFGVRITGIKRTPVPPPSYFNPSDQILTVDRLHEILPTVDHLVLALPGGPSTDKIIGRAELSLLQPGAVIYNVGRGNAIDEEALIEALEEGRLAGAYLDVFRQEPLPESSALYRSSAFLMPHASAIAPNYMDLFLDELIPQIRTYFS